MFNTGCPQCGKLTTYVTTISGDNPPPEAWCQGHGAQRISKIARELGKLGGEATKKKLGVEHFKRISKLGVKARNEKN